MPHTKPNSSAQQVQVRLARIYDPPGDENELRVLVDRLWPRGTRKDDLDLDEWLKELAPSTELRTWYGHKPEKFVEFRRRYMHQLAGPERTRALDRLRMRAASQPLVLLTAARDLKHSHAAVLAAALTEPATVDPVPPSPPEDQGGDPACWLNRVCPDCGRFAAEPPTTCPACGAPIPAHDE